MALILRFSFAAQAIAAFVIFVLGYIGLFATLMLATVIVRCLYEAAKWLNARVSAKRPIPIPIAIRFLQSAGPVAHASAPPKRAPVVT